MGQALKDNQTFDPFALFIAERRRNPDYPPIETDWMNYVEGHSQPKDGETAKIEERGSRDERQEP